MHNNLRLALDLAPLLLFFLAYRMAGLLAATAVLIVFTLVSLVIIYAREKRIAVLPLFTAIAVTLFGSMTLLLQDETFIKIKPTILNLVFALILFGGLYFKKPMLKYLLSDAMALSDEGWIKLSRNWGCFFLLLAALNEIIWRNFSTDFWVNFKVFGMFTLTILFTLSQIPLITRYLISSDHE